MSEITMEDAVAAGDGTLHGAIDHWQKKHAEAEEQIKELQDLTIQLSERLAECQRELLAAQEELEGFRPSYKPNWDWLFGEEEE